MPTNNDGVMIILSSPSGAGKTTLVKELSKLDNYEISISHTTREPRPNENQNEDYFFVDEDLSFIFVGDCIRPKTPKTQHFGKYQILKNT